MQKIYLLLFFCLGILLSSCGKDDETANEFIYDGNTFDITNGFLETYGDNGNGSFDFDVTLSTGVNPSTGTGKGDFVYLDLNTSGQEDLDEVTYNFASERAAGVMVDASVAIDYDIPSATGELQDATGGTVTVSKDGQDYIITFSLTLTNGKTSTGSYKGPLTRV